MNKKPSSSRHWTHSLRTTAQITDQGKVVRLRVHPQIDFHCGAVGMLFTPPGRSSNRHWSLQPRTSRHLLPQTDAYSSLYERASVAHGMHLALHECTRASLHPFPTNKNSSTYVPSYNHPTPPQEPKPIDEIISPYPNLSSFLFDYHFWTSGPTKSRHDRDATQELLTRDDFVADDLKGVNLGTIEEELRGRPSCGQWEQTWGWRKSNLVIGIPKGIKKTAAVQRDEAARNARQCQGAPGPPPSKVTPFLGFKSVSLGSGTDRYARSYRRLFPKTLPLARSTTTRTNRPTTLHSTPPAPSNESTTRSSPQMPGSVRMRRSRWPVSTLSKPKQDLPRVVAAMMLWSDETVLNPFGQNKAWPVYLFFGNQPKSERLNLQLVGDVMNALFGFIVHSLLSLLSLSYCLLPPSFLLFSYLSQPLTSPSVLDDLIWNVHPLDMVYDMAHIIFVL